jgi:hypothetical protein
MFMEKNKLQGAAPEPANSWPRAIVDPQDKIIPPPDFKTASSGDK